MGRTDKQNSILTQGDANRLSKVGTCWGHAEMQANPEASQPQNSQHWATVTAQQDAFAAKPGGLSLIPEPTPV